MFYDLAKVAVNRLAFSQGHELEPHGATAVAVTPGWLRSEMMLDTFGVTEANWRDALDPAAPDCRRLRRTSRCPSRPATSVARSPRWPRTPTGRGGTSSRSTSGRARAPNTASPTRRLAAGHLALHRGGPRARAGGRPRAISLVGGSPLAPRGPRPLGRAPRGRVRGFVAQPTL